MYQRRRIFQIIITVYWREFIMYIEYEYKLKYLKILNIKKFKLNI